MNAKPVTYEQIQSKLMQAASIASLMGWAAVGQEYANPKSEDSLSGFACLDAAKVITELLHSSHADLEVLERQAKEGAV